MVQKDPRQGNAFYYDLDREPLGDVPFYLQQVQAHARALELGCGTGRVLLPLAAACQSILGIDYSPGMIARCQEKMREAGLTNSRVEVGDITRLSLGHVFDLVIAPYRVLQALATDAEVDGLFAVIRRHLAPGGSCILNVFHPNRGREELLSSWAQPDEMVRWEQRLPDGSRVVHSELYERVQADPLVIFPHLIYRRYRGEQLLEEHVQSIKMRCYYADEFKRLIVGRGFVITDTWGGYEGQEFGKGPELIIKFSAPPGSKI